MDGQVYFVISASAPNVLELAQTRGGPAIVVAAAAQGTAHALTPLAQWVQIGTLAGGTAEDAFTLQANGRLSGAIDGGAGANSLQGPDIDTAWTINGADSGTLTAAGGNPVLIANGFTQIGSLIGGGADDAFAVTVAGVLTGHLSGGAGVNRLQGADRATAWTIDGADSGSMSMGAPVVFDGTQVNPGGNPFETEITFGAPHNLRVGQAVRYGHGAGGTDVVGLVDGQVYFVISVSAANVLELAHTRGGAAINLGAAAQGTVHELTPVMDFSAIGNLVGGVQADTFVAGLGRSLSGTMDGGAGPGANTLRGADRATAWTINGADSGSLSMGAPVLFNGTLAGTNPFADPATIEFGTAHGLSTGQAVRYGHGPNGSDVNGLQEGTIYYVRVASATSVQLAATRTDALNGANLIDLGPAAQGTAHELTPVMEWVQIGTLAGGTAQDGFTLQANGRLSGAIDGGAGANTLQGPDVNTAWTINGADSGTLTGAGGNPVLIANGFTRIGSLIGGGADDAFTVTLAGVLTGPLSGGGGVNRLQGADRATAWTLSGADSGSLSMGAPVLFDGTLAGTNPFADPATIEFGTAHGLSTGQAVRYGHGPNGSDVNGLQDGTIYYARVLGGTSVQLAATRTDALNGANLIDLGPAAQGTAHELTPVMEWVQIGTLAGGTAGDAFTLQANGRLTGSIDGGGGANTLQGPDVDTAWTLSGADAGDVSVGTALTFDGTSALIVNPVTDELTLGAGHNLRTGQAVRYGHGPNGSDVNGLQEGTIYYVRVASATSVQLAATRTDALNGANLIDLGAAASGTQHALTPLVEWVQIGTLAGGTAQDAFTLQANGRLSGAIDGGAGANSLQGPDVDTAWTINGTDSGTLTGAGGNPVLIANGFTRIASLIGGGADDAFTVTVAGVLTDRLSGGAGANRLQGADRATAWTISGADSGSLSMGAPVVFDGTQVNPGGNPFETEISFGAPHNLRVGQAVRYGHGAGGTDVVGLGGRAGLFRDQRVRSQCPGAGADAWWPRDRGGRCGARHGARAHAAGAMGADRNACGRDSGRRLHVAGQWSAERRDRRGCGSQFAARARYQHGMDHQRDRQRHAHGCRGQPRADRQRLYADKQPDRWRCGRRVHCDGGRGADGPPQRWSGSQPLARRRSRHGMDHRRGRQRVDVDGCTGGVRRNAGQPPRGQPVRDRDHVWRSAQLAGGPGGALRPRCGRHRRRGPGGRAGLFRGQRLRSQCPGAGADAWWRGDRCWRCGARHGA